MVETTNIVRKLFDGVVPERATDIDSITKTYGPQFRLLGDREGFNLDAGGFSAIQYTSRSTRQMWLFGYAGRQALHCYASLIVLLKSWGDTLDINEINKIPNQAAEDDAFKAILDAVKKLNTAFHEDDFEWPSDTPMPEKGRPSDAERAAVYDLTCMATAYVFLHELKKGVTKHCSDTAIEELYEHEKHKPTHPPRLGIRTLSNVTTAAAIDLFDREAVKSTILRSSEGEKILSGHAAQKLSLWNSLWGGEPVRVDRKTSNSCVVNPRTTLYIQAQPSVMQRFVAKGGENARGIGFFARTHIAYPITTQGMRSVKQIIKAPNYEYDALVKDLFQRNIEAGKVPDFERCVIRFSNDAKGRWFVMANEIEREICFGGRFEGFGDHASKLADNIARMAVLLHCAEFGLKGEVSLATLNDAILLCFWFSNEFVRLFRAPSEEQRDYLSLQDWFNQKRAEGYRYLRKNHVRKYCPNALRDAGKLNILQTTMQNNGEIRMAVFANKAIIDLYPNYQDDQALLMSVVSS